MKLTAHGVALALALVWGCDEGGGADADYDSDTVSDGGMDSDTDTAADCWDGRDDLRVPPELCSTTCEKGASPCPAGMGCYILDACGSGETPVCASTEEAFRTYGCTPACGQDLGSSPIVITGCWGSEECCPCCP